ncbi:MAG: efflux RND transporter permease subunit [Myxococcota bacterium]
MNLRERLPALAWDRPVSILMLFIAAMVLGFVAYARLPVQLLPSGIEPRFLWVWVPYPNAAPIEVDDRIVRPIETQFGTVSGVKQMISRASSGSAQFTLEFHSSVDMDEAYNSVVDRLERALPDLPEDVERYGVFRYNPADEPIVLVGASFPEDTVDPYHVMTRVVQPAIERVPGVAALDVWGVPQLSVLVEYDKDRLYSHGINLGEVQRRIQTDNFQMSSGKIQDRGQMFHARALSPFQGIEDLSSFPVRDDLVLSDIADIRYGAALSSHIRRIDGKEAAAVAVRKDSAANTIDVAERIQAVFDNLSGDPRTDGANFFVFFNQGDLIAQSLQTLVNAALFGGLFAVLILWMFLREWRMTVLIAASIPFSILITLGLLYFTGGSLNLLSMMGLMLAVGMVVDNAIVVVETIYRRRGRGDPPREAAVRGTAEVNLAILVSTITTMIVFLPVILMSEDARIAFFLEAIGVPVIFALAASLVVALFFAPLATRYIGEAQVKEDPGWLLRLSRVYEHILRFSLRRRPDGQLLMIGGMLLTLMVAVPGIQCNPEAESNLNDFVVRFTVPEQADLKERDAIVRQMEETVEAHREEWGVRVYRSRLMSGSMQGRIFIHLEEDGPSREEVMAMAQGTFPTELAGVEVRIGWEGGFEQEAANQLNLSVNGEDVGVLRELAEEVARRVRSVPGVMGVELDVETDGAQEIQLVVDRQAANRYGVSATSIGTTVAYAMRGTSLPEIVEGEREVDVTSGFSLADRSSLDAIRSFELWSPVEQQLVPMRAVTDVRYGRGPSRISRLNQRTTLGVTLDLAEGVNAGEVGTGLHLALRDMAFPRGYGWEMGASFQQRGVEDDAMLLALGLSVVFVFLLIGILFESFFLPWSIVTTIPMAGLGAAWMLYLTGTDLDFMAFVGLVLLVGVIVNNGIVLVDLITQLRDEGMDRTEAIVTAGRQRLRPILMTAFTTIFGLLPMAFGSSSFIGIPYAPLGRTVIGGLIAGTLLTLLFVPFLYAALDDIRHDGTRWFGWLVSRNRT